jgi:hypothetical protein
MMKGNYHKIFWECALLIVVFICSCQAITTKDLLSAEKTQSPEPISSVVAASMNQAPLAKSLTPDQEGPQTAGSTVIWTGNAYDPDGDKLLYQFWLNGPITGNTWKLMTSWNENNTWNWITSPLDSGVNIIDMRIRDGRHAGPWGHDSHVSAEYNINSIAGVGGSTRVNSKPSLLSLKSNRQSPQDKGVKVTWTAKSSDPDMDTVLYQYVLKGPSTEYQWLPMTDWTTNNVWIWNTGQSKAGIYLIEVWIRDGYHADVENSDDSKGTSFVVMQKGVIE